MMPHKTDKARNLLEALLASFARSLRSPEGTADPVALVWTDTEGQWLPLIASLRTLLPEIYTLGEYDPKTRTGPSIWLKCIVERVLPDVSPPDDKTPILYLPHISRQELRAAGDCPAPFQPLIELQYRGRVWHQSSGRDWSVMAFLISEEGLGLDIAQDRRTEEAMLRALPLLGDTDVASVRGRRLDADDFDRLSVDDPVRDLLRWMSAPEVFEAAARGNRWQSFRNVCKVQFNFDPDSAGAAEAGAKLAVGEGVWDQVWDRFREAPQLYPGVANLLSAPAFGKQSLLTLDASRNPQKNRSEEMELRDQIEAAAALEHSKACALVIELEKRHATRRDWVWAQLGESPWARALVPLVRLAEWARSPLGAATLESAAASYAQDGWQCDRAAMEALAQFRTTMEVGVMVKIVRALYEPWLDKSARHFQELLQKGQNLIDSGVTPVKGEQDVCLLFVDGLRFDMGGWLAEKLEARSLIVRMRHRLAALPTVTATAKAAVTPIASEIRGTSANNFTPELESKPATTPTLRTHMTDAGVDILPADEIPFSSGSKHGGWTECGRIDQLGHKLDGELAHQLEAEVDRVADRVVELLNAGWKKVRIVTDHGWLMLPDGLPKIDLPHYLTETKWSRCAVFKGQGESDLPTYPWHWNSDVRIVSPPGIACFRAGEKYAHGGVSPQECVVPEIVVESGVEAVRASIESVYWRGMRCRVTVKANDSEVTVDLRLNWKQPATSIVVSAKRIGQEGDVNLAVSDDSQEGHAATVVVCDSSGNVLDRKTTTVGEHS